MEEDSGSQGTGPKDCSLEEREELLDIPQRKWKLTDDNERLNYKTEEMMTDIDNLISMEENKTTQKNKRKPWEETNSTWTPKREFSF